VPAISRPVDVLRRIPFALPVAAERSLLHMHRCSVQQRAAGVTSVAGFGWAGWPRAIGGYFTLEAHRTQCRTQSCCACGIRTRVRRMPAAARQREDGRSPNARLPGSDQAFRVTSPPRAGHGKLGAGPTADLPRGAPPMAELRAMARSRSRTSWMMR